MDRAWIRIGPRLHKALLHMRGVPSSPHCTIRRRRVASTTPAPMRWYHDNKSGTRYIKRNQETQIILSVLDNMHYPILLTQI